MGEVAPFLEYGALGVLAIFLVLFVVVQRERDKRSDQRNAEGDDFTRGLVKTAMATQDAQREAWQSLAGQVVGVQQDTAKALVCITEQAAAAEERARQRHQELLEAQRDVKHTIELTQVQR